jgi:hypothetical protein
VDDLHEVWSDDELIERLARGEVPDDPAVAPLVALSRLADAVPPPVPDLDPAALVDDGRNRRYAVRSLAVAVTAVVTLSTSGVAAVVTGDPFRPAKAVWQEIQEHTGRSGEVAQVESGQATGAALPEGPALGEPNAAGDVPPRQPWELRPSPVSAPSASLAADQDAAPSPDAGTPSAADSAFTAQPSPSAEEPEHADTGTAGGDGGDQQRAGDATQSPEDDGQDDAQPDDGTGDDGEPDGQAPDGPEESPSPDDEPPGGDDIEPPLLRTPLDQDLESTPEPLESPLDSPLGSTLEPALDGSPTTDDALATKIEPTAEATQDGLDGLEATDGGDAPTSDEALDEPVDGTVGSLPPP